MLVKQSVSKALKKYKDHVILVKQSVSKALKKYKDHGVFRFFQNT